MNPFFVLPLAGFLLAGLLRSEARGPRAAVLAFKTPLSVLFVLTAWMQAATLPLFHGLLLAGLLFCLAGDVLLALPGNRAFRAGLVGFLAGHMFYGAAFLGTAEPGRWSLVALVPLAAAGWGVWRWLRHRLNGMRVPVAVYIGVISLMVLASVGFLGGGAPRGAGRFLVVGGAVAFYLSDLFVARDRFVHRGVENRFVGLPLYYGGQFMLAFSPGLLS
jgi:uncharacterized membrane protein YhhN